MGSKGLTLKDGEIKPSDSELRFMVAQNGAAARPGDRAQITNVDILEKSIIFEINGGPKKRKKWYQHIEVGGMGGMTPVAPDNNPQNPHGSYVTLAFDRFVPDLSVDQLKKMLAPVFDFTALSAAPLQDKGVQHFFDYGPSLPNLSFGIGASDGNLTCRATASQGIDGSYTYVFYLDHPAVIYAPAPHTVHSRRITRSSSSNAEGE